MKRLMMFIILVTLLAMEAGCVDTSSVQQEMADSKAVNAQQEQYAKTQPVPFFDYSRERSVYTQIYKARNKAVATHTVWRGAMSIIEGDCPSIGFPIPYDVQLTNPEKITLLSLGRTDDYVDGTVEQAEPNGLFSSKTTAATWIMCAIKDQGVAKMVPVYVEGKVTTYPYPVTVDYDKNRVRKAEGAKPSVVITEGGR